MKAYLTLVVAMWLTCSALPLHAQDTAAGAAPAATVAPAEEAKPADEAATQEPAPFDELKFAREFQTMLAAGQFEEAEKQLNTAIEQNPDSLRLPSLHSTAYMYLRRANRPDDALRHLDAYVENLMQSAAASGRDPQGFTRMLGILLDEAGRHAGPERASQILDQYVEHKKLPQSSDGILAAIDSQRILHLAKANRIDEANAIVEKRIEAANEALAKSPDDVAAILNKASALKDRFNLASVVEGGDTEAAFTEFSDFLFSQAQAHPDAAELKQRFETEHLQRVSMLSRTEPDAAEVLLDKIISLQGDAAADAADNPRSPITMLRKQIADARRMLALVGSPAAYPENVDGWVNGEPLTPDSLKGKVVMLDFFAVWCGPCIATFPHLREWHDEFADKGLQIIGVTNYYQYGWNDESGRPERTADIAPEAERAAMEKFVAHHELRHVVAYVTDRSLSEHYVVNGIPHAVIIDRQGKVRLFRIGSGEANAADIKKAIEECLAETPPEA